MTSAVLIEHIFGRGFAFYQPDFFQIYRISFKTVQRFNFVKFKDIRSLLFEKLPIFKIQLDEVLVLPK